MGTKCYNFKICHKRTTFAVNYYHKIDGLIFTLFYLYS